MIALAAIIAALTPAPAPDTVLGPGWFLDCLAYYSNFESAPDEPLVKVTGIETDLAARRGEAPGGSPVLTDAGFLGRGLEILDWGAPLVLRGEGLSPHRPLTLSFWWCLPFDMTIDGGYYLFELTGAGYIGLFSRGRGEWCALQRPAGVFQVYYFSGIQNVNGIYDFDLAAHCDLRAGVWHHSAVVFRRARTAQVYTDGEMVFEVTVEGRAFSEEDNLRNLALGGPLVLDELAVLDRAVEADMIADYWRGMTQLRTYHTE